MPTDLASLTSGEVAAAGDVLLVVPVGSTEQHGPHLPLSTDTDVAVALARRLADRRPDVLVAPAIPYGSSGEHDGFAGTLSIGAAATELVLVELGRSALPGTVRRMLLVSAHGGNAGPVTAAVRLLRSEGRDVRAWAPRWRGDAHAGRTETSVQLALDPARVRPAAVAGNTADVRTLLPAMQAGGVRAVSPNGVLGDPGGSTAAEGAALLDAAVEDLAGFVTRWLAADTAPVSAPADGFRRPAGAGTPAGRPTAAVGPPRAAGGGPTNAGGAPTGEGGALGGEERQ
ncbi:MAG TPA: mycofactocin biosynthesis peptidyl-dipeptidase MftE [Mycobacteriales bacterium]|nr:mycofactocin biosynthesis peptidyl-dipeptidase MftE [Mycobacteriales bacterium]